VEAVLIEAGF